MSHFSNRTTWTLARIEINLHAAVDNETEYEAKQILDSRYGRNQLQHLIDLKGYGVEERSWEPASNVKNASDLVKDFHLVPGQTGAWRSL